DGLILDTELPMYRAWCALFETHGAAPPTIDEWAAEIGTLNGLDLHGLLVERATRPVDLAEADVWRRGHRDLLLAEQQARPGVVDWLGGGGRRRPGGGGAPRARAWRSRRAPRRSGSCRCSSGSGCARASGTW